MTIDNMETTKYDTWPAVAALNADWDRLLAQNDVRNIFLTYEWHHTWWATYGADHTLYVLAVKNGGKLIGIAPLMVKQVTRLGHTRRVIHFIGTPQADYSDIIGEDKPLILTHIFAYLRGHQEDWDKIDLTHIKEESHTLPALRALLEKEHCRYRIKEIETCVSYVFEGQESERATFELKRTRTLNKAHNDLNNAGGLRLEEIRDTQQILSLLPAFFHCHINRWMQTPTPSKFLGAEHRCFYEAMVRNLAPLGHVGLMILRHAEQPIAYFFVFSYDRIAYLYTPTHEMYYNRKSPGNILNNLLVRHFIRRGYVAVDHTRGAEQHKSAFANKTARNLEVAIYRRATGYALSQAYEGIKKLLPIRKLDRISWLMRLKDRIYSYCLTHGLRASLLAGIRKFRRALFSSDTMLVLEYQPFPLPDLTLPADITIEQFTESDIETIAFFLGFEPGSRKHQVILERFQRGGECFGFRYCGTMASIIWGIFKRDFSPGFNRELVLGDHEVLVGDGLTSPIFRGRGLQTLSLVYCLKRYTARNLTIKALVAKDNLVSLRNCKKLNFKRISSFRWVTVCGIRLPLR